MNILKIFLLGLFFCLSFVADSYALKKPTVRICLAGGLLKVISSYGKAFINGATLATENLSSNNIQYEIKTYFYEPTPFSPHTAMKNMLAENCSVVLGFNTTNELLVIKELMESNKILVISMFGELNSDLEKLNNLITIQPPPEFLVEHLFQYLDTKNQKFNNTLLITSVDKKSLIKSKEAYLNYLKTRSNNIDQIDIIERSLNLNKFKHDFSIKGKDFDSIVILSRSIAAAKVTDSIRQKLIGKDLPLILSTEHLGSATVPFYYNNLKNKEVSVLFPRHSSLNDDEVSFKEYLNLYKAKYGKNPAIISGYAYDSVGFIIKIIKSLKPNILSNYNLIPSSIVLDAARNINYKGITGVKIAEGLKVGYTKSFVIKVDKKGYRTIDKRIIN